MEAAAGGGAREPLLAPSVLVVSPDARRARGAADGERRVRFAQHHHALEAWEVASDGAADGPAPGGRPGPAPRAEDRVPVDAGLLGRPGGLADGAAAAAAAAGAAAPGTNSGSPTGTWRGAALRARQGALSSLPRTVRLHTLAITLVMCVFCVASVRLVQVGFFDGGQSSSADDIPEPLVSNESATDRNTGEEFALRTTPPGLDAEYDLFGLRPSSAGRSPPNCVLGLYVENRTGDLRPWKKLAEASGKSLAGLFRELLGGQHPLSIRLVTGHDTNGTAFAALWASELDRFLVHHAKLRRSAGPAPAGQATTTAEEAQFKGWFPEHLDAGAEIWVHWNPLANSTQMFLDGTPRSRPPAQGRLGAAIMESAIALHGPGLINVLKIRSALI